MIDAFKLSLLKIKPVRKLHVLNLYITKPNQVRYNEKSIRVLGPKIWNNLPPHLKSTPNLLSFKST